MPLDLTSYKPQSGYDGDAAQVANGFTALETWGNGAIDLTALKQTGALPGQALVWDGTKWAPSSVAAATLVSALPGSPSDKQTLVYADSLATPSFVWQLLYVAAVGKWLFIGGVPLVAEVLTSQTTASTTYAALATVGPTITIPLAGDYDVTVEFTGSKSTGSATGCVIRMSFDIGATAAVDGDSTPGGHYGDNTTTSLQTTRRKTLAAGTVLTAKYKTSAGTATFLDRRIRVTPVRVS